MMIFLVLFLFALSACLISVTGFSFDLNRRDALSIAGIGGVLEVQSSANAAVSSVKPIAVIGANGRTGSLCVASCLERGIPVRALARSGSWNSDGNIIIANKSVDSLLTVQACNVKDPEALASGVAGCRGVIYAASASKQGGNAQEVDNLGVVAAADACLLHNIPRYTVISSTAVTRPKSLGYKFTNVFGGIMDEKRRGEQGVIARYKERSPDTSSYVLIRPGGLEEPKRNIVLGPSSLELSQGDALAGIVSRADLAEVAIETILSDEPNLRNTAFELYYTDSAQPCEGRFKALLGNGSVPRIHGDTYQDLFRSLQPDGSYSIPV